MAEDAGGGCRCCGGGGFPTHRHASLMTLPARTLASSTRVSLSMSSTTRCHTARSPLNHKSSRRWSMTTGSPATLRDALLHLLHQRQVSLAMLAPALHSVVGVGQEGPEGG